jgi:phosphate transport system substrate-binding protein
MMSPARIATFIACMLAAALFAAPADAQRERETIRIVGSSTVFPFSTAVAESFGARTSFATPVVESTGSGGGFRLFCAGVGVGTPDIVNSSRRIQPSEFERCRENGVTDITEVMFGADGIVIGYAAPRGRGPGLDITLTQLWLALAARIPADETCSSFVDNPYQSWSDIDSSLPAQRIEVFGPPPTSGTRDAFVKLAMEGGARGIDCMQDLHANDLSRFDQLAGRIREDGAWIDSGENDNAIVQTLINTPSAFGVFGYSFYDQNSDRLAVADVDGVTPDFDTIAEGDYPVSRTLFFYVKNQHEPVIPGLVDYIVEFTSEDAWGEFGYLSDRGLIPLLEENRQAIGARARALTPMDPPER